MIDRASGIYKIVHKESGKQYIGSAVDMYRRRVYHLVDLRKNKHRSQKLQRAWNKYGENAFEFFTILHCDKEDLIAYEQFCLDLYGAVAIGYNNSPTAGSSLGVKHTDETRERMRQANLGKKLSPEHISKMKKTRKETIARLGYYHSPETCQKISSSSRGKPKPANTEAQKAKISAALKGRPKPPRTKEHILKIAKAKRGVKLPPRSPDHMKTHWINRRANALKKKLLQEGMV